MATKPPKESARAPINAGERKAPRRSRMLEGNPATPTQKADAERLKQSWGSIKHMLNVRIRLMEDAPEGSYDSDREAYNLAIPYYAVWASQKVFAEVEKRGDSESYAIFISLMKDITDLIDVELFALDGKEFVARFDSLKSSLDKCKDRFGTTPSLEFEEVWDRFRFAAKGMRQESRKPVTPTEGGSELDEKEEYAPGI